MDRVKGFEALNKMKFTKRDRKVTKNRLMKLVKKLQKLPVSRFDYIRWVGDGWMGKPDLSCGTSPSR